MIIENIASDRRNFIWTILHITLGFVCTLTPFVLIIWFYFIFISNFLKSNRLLKQKKPAFFLMFFSYLISFEVLDRMAKTSPFLPYELGKYLLIIMGILGLASLGVRSYKGLWMAILITPAVFYDFSGKRVYFDIINYYLAPLAVGLGVAFIDRFKITEYNFNQILKFIWLGCLSSLVYTFIKTPDLEEIEFALGANFETTAGHSSNQVSTILGLGMFLSFYSVFKKLRFTGYLILDIIILIGFTFQGLISFSRGGILVSAFAIVLLILLPENKTKVKENKSKSFIISMGAIILLYGVFELTNSITGGNLLLRYKGETAGTLRGTKEITADHYVTGRLGIFEKDINLWKNNLLTGVGCGSSKSLREQGSNVAAHVELSRLLAEHGLAGLFYSFLFFSLPYDTYKLNTQSNYRVIMLVLLLIAILTTFHAAMRTFVTPLFMILGVMKIKDN